MKTFAPAVAFLACLCTCEAGASAAPLSTEQTSRIDTIVYDALMRSHVPGISIAIARDGDVVYAHGYGLRDVSHAATVDGSTIFEIGSLTKQFTAASRSRAKARRPRRSSPRSPVDRSISPRE